MNRKKIIFILIVLLITNLSLLNIKSITSLTNNKINVNINDNSSSSLDLAHFWKKSIYTRETSPHAADLNGDGYLDVVFGSNENVFAFDGSSGKTIWRNTYAAYIQSIVGIADINNDSKLEILFTTENGYLYCLNNLVQFVGKNILA